MPASPLRLLIALALAGLTLLGADPLALVNLRLAWSAATTAHGDRAPVWFIVLRLGTGARIATAMIGALTPR
ncbi:hypothetical protein QOL99_16105 [Deinococcus sp. MIMF12]|uniref:Uncharacterized protein n=1 Tax=Deinococcus rhizophilus TaxID=3049544 RepID=A0ABT7JKT7_9DEIO|nr:hypothetical protein [Deinococcus rhizophilus]MDL2345659.1 hypothetical protein [Deinococcus rhizophilus]